MRWFSAASRSTRSAAAAPNTLTRETAIGATGTSVRRSASQSSQSSHSTVWPVARSSTWAPPPQPSRRMREQVRAQRKLQRPVRPNASPQSRTKVITCSGLPSSSADSHSAAGSTSGDAAASKPIDASSSRSRSSASLA